MEGELTRVLRCYRLGEFKSAQRIERGFVDENWMVETDRGRYFLKRRHPRRRQPGRQIRAQHDLIEILRQRAFPAPILVPTARGETFLDLDGELYEIQEYIDGEPYDHDRPEHLGAAGEVLGHYHACVEGFAPRAFRERGRLYGPANTREILMRLREEWQLDLNPVLARIAWQLEAQVDWLAERFSRHGPLPYVVIHGDYHAGNLLFHGDRIIGVVDYDKANWQPRVAEVAEALIYFASPAPGHLEHLVYPGFLIWEPFARFTQAYARAVLLTADEIRALPDYVCCIWVSVSLRRLLEKSGHRPAEALEALQEVLTLANWAGATSGEMIEIARDSMKEENL